MKLREYEYILTIACEQNLTRAAERLYVSQPALSRLLKNVEIEVGMPLFERRGKKMVLNGAGKIFVETAREIVDLDSRMKKKIHDMDIRNSELTICNPLLRSEFLVKNVLPVFCASYRDVPIISTIISQKKIQDVLQSGIAQLAFGIITPVYEQKLGYEKIAQEEMVLMVPVGHPLVEKAEVRDDCNYPYIDSRYLCEQHFVLPSPNSYSGEFAERFLTDHSIIHHVIMRLNFTGYLYNYVFAGNGIAILPSIPLKSIGLERKVVYLSLQDKSYAHTVGLLYNKNHILSGSEGALLDIIREVYYL